jgi:serine protease Do
MQKKCTRIFHESNRERLGVRRCCSVLLALVFLLPAGNAAAQTPPGAHSTDALHQLNDSIEALVQHVSPSVVQILVTGYAASEEPGQTRATDIVGRRQVIGSGVIVDPEGYIVTNAHVVSGAEKITVIVPPEIVPGDPNNASQNTQGKNYPARVIGVSKDLDLAVIKIEAQSLPAISIHDSSANARQGEMVFAFGSPQGLRNTVTMGVVSAVARQPDPDSPLVYVQTDTPINPGNSGGPLVDADGHLVGINTFIISSSGGNQGLGFAIPAGVVASAYPQLLKYGHIHRPAIGALVQTITPELAAGLHLGRDFGIIVSDISPGGSADKAGLRIQDIILSVDGAPIPSLPQFAQILYVHKSGESAKFEVLRGADRVPLNIPLVDRPHKEDSLVEIADPAKNLVRRLGILGIELTLELDRTLPDLRIPSGVIVAARTLGSGLAEIPLQAGDVIHGINGTTIVTLRDLRDVLDKQKPGDAIAIQIERYGQIIYISFVL